MTMRERVLIAPPGAQLIFWNDGTLRLRYDSEQEDVMLQWAHDLVNGMETAHAMQMELDAKQAAETEANPPPPQPSLPQGNPSNRTVTDQAPIPKGLEAFHGLRKEDNASTNNAAVKGMKRQVLASQRPPKPMIGRAILAPPPPAVPDAPRTPPDLPDVPPDEPTAIAQPDEVAPPDSPARPGGPPLDRPTTPTEPDATVAPLDTPTPKP